MSGGRSIVVMGVAGCGKSSVGKSLAAVLGAEFVDADSLHPRSNVAKMAGGTPLNDADREPWLRLVGSEIAHRSLTTRVVVACSALKLRYRDLLRESAARDLYFVHLHGSAELLHERLTHRADHFMPPSLLTSQLEALERLTSAEKGHEQRIDLPIPQVVDQARLAFEKASGEPADAIPVGATEKRTQR